MQIFIFNLFYFLILVEFALSEDGGRQVLRPLSLQDLAPSGTVRRSNDITQLDFRETETLLWGNPSNNSSTFILANMTMYTGTNELILSLERFRPMLKSVTCGSTTILAFNNNESFQYAIKAWDWVNQHENHSLIMVADDPGCGPDYQRVPFYIYSVDYDEQNYIAHLNGSEKSWDEVAHTFDLVYGTASKNTLNSNSKYVRDLGEWDVTKSLQVPLSTTLNGPILSEPVAGGLFELDCVDCGTSGSIEFTFSLKVVDFVVPTEASITVSPRSIQGDLGMRLTSNIPKSPLPISISYSKTIFDIPIPSLDFEIPVIGGLGFHFKIKGGIGVKNPEGQIVMDFGATSRFSDAAIAKIDIANIDDQEFSGWTPIFDVMPFSLTEQSSLDIDFYVQWTFGPQFTLFNQGFEAALVLKLPELSVSLDQSNSAGSTCSSQHQTGTSVDISIGCAIALRAGKGGDLAITQDVTSGPIFGRRSLEVPPVEIPTLLAKKPRKGGAAKRELIGSVGQVENVQLAPQKRKNGDEIEDVELMDPRNSDDIILGDLEKRFSLGMRVELVLFAPKGWHLWGTCLASLPEGPSGGSSVAALPTTTQTSLNPSPTNSPGPTALPASPGPKSCQTTGDGLRYRLCPNTSVSCVAIGEYPLGTLVPFVCQTPGELISGDWSTSAWGKTTSGYFVSLAYIDESCAESLSSC